MEKYNNITLKGGTEIRNLKISRFLDADILGVLKTIYNEDLDEVLDIQCCYDGTNWFSLRGYKAQNTFEETGGNVPILEGLSSDGKSYKFRVLKAGGEAGSEDLTISNSGGVITIDLSGSFKDRIDDIEDVLSGKVDKELKTGSQSVYKVLSDNNFTDLLLAKLSTIQIKKDTSGGGKYYLVFNDGTNDDIQLGVDIPLDSVIDSGSVKVCTVVNEPVDGYEVDDKYIDFTIANSSEHVYILVSDLVDTMEGFDGTEIKTTVIGNTIKAELKDNSIEIARLKKVVLGTITKSNTLISEVAEYTLKEAIIVLACNIKDLYDRKANKNQTIIAPVSDSDQITANDYDITVVLQKALNNIKYLFDNKANTNHNHDGTYSTTDTKNTAGATNTSYKIYLVGSTEQSENPQTYTHDTAYVGTDGNLYSGNSKTITNSDLETNQIVTPTLNPTWIVRNYEGTVISSPTNPSGEAITGTNIVLEYGFKPSMTVKGKWVTQTGYDDPISCSGLCGTSLPASNIETAATSSINLYNSTTYSSTIFPITTSSSWTIYTPKKGITVSGGSLVLPIGNISASARTQVTYQLPVYYGNVINLPITETTVEGLLTKTWKNYQSNSKSVSPLINSTDSQYWIYAYPAAWGDLSTISNADGDWMAAFTSDTVSITGAPGLEILYKYYITVNRGAFKGKTIYFS